MPEQSPTYETLPPDIKERYGIRDTSEKDLTEELEANSFARILNRSHLEKQ